MEEKLRESLKNSLSPKEITIPKNLKATLRPYQERGIAWLYHYSSLGFGVCIADDMGLGKTLQVLGLLLKHKEDNSSANPSLVICPTT